ncbi:MAG: flagellar hook-basal body complex protein FliE [Minwuia thermotolerans]|nr:flagellar hook-basal body complex protein FliE [Minwuia sp.]GJL87262.1 MAG: flagellar hook-basal body complex protein FliE [Minwuia thermotolerans]
MDVTLQNAAMAYGKALGRGGDADPSGSDTGMVSGAQGGSFADMVREAAEGAVGSLEKSEQVAMSSNVDKAGLTDVVVAVNNAEIALQTVVAVRDRVVDAYQQIIRMPI